MIHGLCCFTASTAVTTKKVVKPPKDVAVKKETPTTKSLKAATIITTTIATTTTVNFTSTQATNSIIMPITSTSSQVKLPTPPLPVAKITMPPQPSVTKLTMSLPPSLTSYTATPLPGSKYTTSAPVTKYTTPTPPVINYTAFTPAVTKCTTALVGNYTTLTVGTVLQARPSMTSSTSMLPTNKVLPRPIFMNLPNVQLEKILAVTHPLMQLTTGGGSPIYSSAVTMSLPPQSILRTTLINQKHESPSQWQPLSLSNVHTNLASTSTAPKVVIKASEIITSSSSNHQVLQEHSYQRADDVKSTVNNSLPLNNSSASEQALPKLFPSPMNSPFK